MALSTEIATNRQVDEKRKLDPSFCHRWFLFMLISNIHFGPEVNTETTQKIEHGWNGGGRDNDRAGWSLGGRCGEMSVHTCNNLFLKKR